MHARALIYLMYHEIEVAGRPLCHRDQGYVRYAVAERDFSEQLLWLRNRGVTGVSVSQALAETTSPSIVFTFDDGCASDLTVAAPALKASNFGATFYITLGFLGRPGYMVAQQVRALADAGFDIGCHSMTHPYLDELDSRELQREIGDAKTELENMIGRPVLHFSCPGGRWSTAVVRFAMKSGYRTVATSRIGSNRPDSDPFRLARIAVMRGTPLTAYQALCQGRGLWRRQLRDFLQGTTRRVLGNSWYDRLRSVALDGRTHEN
jgi:peptidoglycan/xylan/chitin deacetylase (PgdA/CDA1 family)